MRENKGTQGRLWADEGISDALQSAEELLGKAGRKLYMSMRVQRPTTIRDACIFDGEARRIWSGDVEIARDWATLIKLSARVGPLHILSGKDCLSVKEGLSVSEIRKRAAVVVEHGRMLYSRDFALKVRLRKEAARAKSGKR